VVLLHGYAETGHMWRPMMSLLAERHTVVVPDLRGAGGSAKPASGYDKKTMAIDGVVGARGRPTRPARPW
jgi:pimeloyl-ACP methyl ester carboxylesterase